MEKKLGFETKLQGNRKKYKENIQKNLGFDGIRNVPERSGKKGVELLKQGEDSSLGSLECQGLVWEFV